VHIYSGENEEFKLKDAAEEEGDLPAPDPELISRYIIQPSEVELAGKGFTEVGPDGEPLDSSEKETGLEELELNEPVVEEELTEPVVEEEK
jgi:hypothetical protein